MEEERLRKEKEGQLAILKENMDSLQIQNLQEVETIKREIENRLVLVTEEAKILKHEKEEMEIKIDQLEILAKKIDDIVKRQKRELIRREEESKRLDKELIEERRIRKETESEVHGLKKEIESLKQRLLAKTGQIGDTHKVVMELADLMNQLKDEVNSDD
ncbi:ribonuclease Y-like [Palaemon carinicauda]|uniref:ribonuclease Y-like n=1 Tax=Palaemon carinicauda TaxID=392227 RepID=UPI0035B6521E